MNVAITFSRQKRCSHSLERECTTCFKHEMWKWMGNAQFQKTWARRLEEEPNEELIDSLTAESGTPL